MKTENIDKPTKEQIDAWKKEHGEVNIIEVAEEADKFEANTISPDLDDLPRLTGYLKKPDRKIQNFALTVLPKNMIAAGKAIVKDCWLGGDRRLLTDDAYATAAAMQAIELIEIHQARLKKA